MTNYEGSSGGPKSGKAKRATKRAKGSTQPRTYEASEKWLKKVLKAKGKGAKGG